LHPKILYQFNKNTILHPFTYLWKWFIHSIIREEQREERINQSRMKLQQVPVGIPYMSQTTNLQKAKKNNRILLAEDNSCLREVVYQILTAMDCQITKAESGEVAIEALNKEDFDLVITDLNMGKVNGIEVLKKTKELDPETMVIIMTANHDVTFYNEVLELDACDYLLKPFELSDLLERVSQCLRKRKSTGSNRKPTKRNKLSNDHSLNA